MNTLHNKGLVSINAFEIGMFGCQLTIKPDFISRESRTGRFLTKFCSTKIFFPEIAKEHLKQSEKIQKISPFKVFFFIINAIHVLLNNNNNIHIIAVQCKQCLSQGHCFRSKSKQSKLVSTCFRKFKQQLHIFQYKWYSEICYCTKK